MKKIVFVCTGNTCRSPMAEMLMKKLLSQKGVKGVKVSSAGLQVAKGDTINEMAKLTLQGNGVKLFAFKSKQLTKKMIDESDLVICMTAGHKNAIPPSEKVFTLAQLTGTVDVIDPYGRNGEFYQRCFECLEVALIKLVELKF